ncbi:MAG TPA: hypothetical protein VES67_00495 [Vicinamibacterales bacterium]|nr:hypothetical protein [Vicinamibacterales bacterium]
MQQTILSYGPPPLTVEAADAGLDMIDFIAAAVRGVDPGHEPALALSRAH